jgi:hypothetical protein
MKFEIIGGDPRTIHRDKRIPLKVRGLMDLILGLPLHWNFTLNGLAELVPDSKESIEACLKVLIQFNYAKKVNIRSKKTGKLRRRVMRFYENGNHGGAVVPIPKATEQNLPGFDPRPTKVKLQSPNGAVPAFAHDYMYRLCYMATTAMESRSLTSTQRSKIASVLGRLRDAGADFNDLTWFEEWWKKDWRSKDRVTKVYQAPRPEQVAEHWWVAVKSKPTIAPVEDKPTTGNNVLDFTRLHEVMAHKALGNKK